MTIVQHIDVQQPALQQPAVPQSAFATELRARLAEASAALAAAESAGDTLLAQIAESDLADLRALAARNDVPTA